MTNGIFSGPLGPGALGGEKRSIFEGFDPYVKKEIWPDASVVDDRRHEAEINFGRAAFRPAF